eukprot:gene7722-9046_t
MRLEDLEEEEQQVPLERNKSVEELEIDELIRHSTELIRHSTELMQQSTLLLEEEVHIDNNNNNSNNNNNHNNNNKEEQTERLKCRMHRSSYAMTQLGQKQASVVLSEEDPASGMGWREPGPQGFLTYAADYDSSVAALTSTSTAAVMSTTTTTTTTTTRQHQLLSSSGSGAGHLWNSFNHNNNNLNVSTASSGELNRSGGGNKLKTSSNNPLASSGVGIGVARTTSLKDETKRKSLRANRLGAKNEDDRRKRKEQKRARAKEKPIYVGSVEELPPECIKMIKKSRIPDDQLRQHFEILLPILRFRTGFNLRSSTPKSQPLISPETSSSGQPKKTHQHTGSTGKLANGEPPNRKSSLNAMFSIATQGCGGLERPEKWSEGFREFLSLCLEVDPSKRSTAEQLLTKHGNNSYESREQLIQLDNPYYLAYPTSPHPHSLS